MDYSNDELDQSPEVKRAKMKARAEKKKPLLLKLAHEYNLIQNKMSKLSANERKKVIDLYHKTFGDQG